MFWLRLCVVRHETVTSNKNSCPTYFVMYLYVCRHNEMGPGGRPAAGCAVSFVLQRGVQYLLFIIVTFECDLI